MRLCRVSEEKETFGERLRRLRKKAGLTQEELSEILNISIRTFQRWEWGENLPRMNEIKSLASALKVPENELLNEPQQEHWVLHIKVAENDEEEYIDMTKNLPRTLQVLCTPKGVYLKFLSNWKGFYDDEDFDKIIQQLKDSKEDLQRIGRSFKENPQSDS